MPIPKAELKRYRALVKTLETNNIAVRSVAGELLFLHAMHELNSEEQAAEMVRKAFRRCALDRLLTVKIDGEPKVIERNRASAVLRVRCRFDANPSQWRMVQGEIKRLLDRLASDHGVFSTVQQSQTNKDDLGGHWWPWEESRDTVYPAVKEGEWLVYLLKDHSTTWSRTYWDLYAVPRSIVVDALGELLQREHTFRIRLLDSENRVIKECAKNVAALGKLGGFGVDGRGFMRIPSSSGTQYIVAPLFFFTFPVFSYSPSCYWEEEIAIPLEDLRSVSKNEASLSPPNTN